MQETECRATAGDELPSAFPPNGSARASGGRRLCYLAVTLVAVAAFQESVFRFFFPLPDVEQFNRTEYCLQELQGEPGFQHGVANTRWRDINEPDGYEFEGNLNLYGFRGQQFRVAKRSDVARVLFVGDSFVEGLGAAEQQSISADFQQQLAHGTPVEAINLGVSGAGIPDVTSLARDSVRLLRPNWMFLVVCCNDLPGKNLVADPRSFQPTNFLAPRLWQLISRVQRSEVIPFRYCTSKPIVFFKELSTEPAIVGTAGMSVSASCDPEIVAAMRRGTCNPFLLQYRELLREMLQFDQWSEQGSPILPLAAVAQDCRAHGCGMTLVYIPSHLAVHERYQLAHDRIHRADPRLDRDWRGPRYRQQQVHLAELASLLQIPFIDTTDAFIQADQQTPHFWALDGHCNARGYALIASLCSESISRGMGQRPE